jgi:AcrR family transcriptional regulator
MSPPPLQTNAAPSGKRDLTKAANRAVILSAARQVFGEVGYDAATVRDIVRRTGLSVGAFYNYFRSKEEIFVALADDGARRFRPILEAQHAKAASYEEALRGGLSAYFEFIAQEHEAWRAQRPAGEPRPHARGTPEMGAVFEEVRRVLAEAMARSHGAQVDLDYLAAACIAIAREVGDKMLERRPIDTAGATEFCVRLILDGVAGLARPDT